MTLETVWCPLVVVYRGLYVALRRVVPPVAEPLGHFSGTARALSIEQIPAALNSQIAITDLAGIRAGQVRQVHAFFSSIRWGDYQGDCKVDRL